MFDAQRFGLFPDSSCRMLILATVYLIGKGVDINPPGAHLQYNEVRYPLKFFQAANRAAETVLSHVTVHRV